MALSNEPVRNDRSLQVKGSGVRGQGSEVQEFRLEANIGVFSPPIY